MPVELAKTRRRLKMIRKAVSKASLEEETKRKRKLKSVRREGGVGAEENVALNGENWRRKQSPEGENVKAKKAGEAEAKEIFS